MTPTALITGGSLGLGRALAHRLSDDGWNLILDGRRLEPILDLAASLPRRHTIIRGDVAVAPHREELAQAVANLGGLDLLVNNASTLGPTPMPPLAEVETRDLADALTVNVLAPLALTQLVLGHLAKSSGTVINVTSDAAVEPYPGWGSYAISKAALDQMSAVLGVEQAGIRVYSVDPGDMRTEMHQAAYKGEDISDRPLPETAVPAFIRLLAERPPSGRYRATDLLAEPAL